jgi:hypothetical protein
MKANETKRLKELEAESAIGRRAHRTNGVNPVARNDR